MNTATRILAAAALWMGGTAFAQGTPQGQPPAGGPGGAPPPAASRVDLPPIVATPTGQRLPGKVIWFDLLSRDPAAVRPFYEGVLGWSFEDRDGYLVARDGGQPVAGILRMPAPAPGAAVPQSRWMPLISVPDVARAAAAAQKGGGRILEGPGSLGARGRYVAVADPRGAQFVLVTATGGDPLDADAPPPGWMWAELWTDDLKGSATFYKAVVGYEVWQVGSGKGATWIFGSGGRPRARAARMPFEKVPAQWLPYVVVKDLKVSLARTAELGGNVLRKPGAKGPQFAVISDPGGATFIVEQRPEQPAEESAQAPPPAGGAAAAGAAAAAAAGAAAGTGPTPPGTQPAPTAPTGSADPFGIGAAQERNEAEIAAAAAAAVSGGAVTSVPGPDVSVVVAPSPFVNVWIAPPAWGPFWGPSWWAYPPGWVGAPWWGPPPVWGPGWMPPAYPGRPPYYPGYRPPPPPPRPGSGAYPRPPAPAPRPGTSTVRPGAPATRPSTAPAYRAAPSAPSSRPAPSAPAPSSRPAPSAPRR